MSQAIHSQSAEGTRPAAMPAARALARQRGLDLAKVAGSGPGGVILARDVAALETAGAALPTPATGLAPSSPRTTSLARGLAQKMGVSLEGVAGSGPRGRITRQDVLTAAAYPPAAAPAVQTKPATSMRKTIARRMSQSAFTAPHIYFFAEVGMDRLLALLQEIRESVQKTLQAKLSLNDLLIKAVGLKLREFPLLNASFAGENITLWDEVNVGLAVALEEGLIVPAVAGADKASLGEIAAQRADLVERARSRQLKAAEIERGTFTVSSLASFAITHFTAIINPPQSAILSVGATRETLYLEQGMLKTRRIATLGLSVDHRLIDGALAAKFLTALKETLENPGLLLL